MTLTGQQYITCLAIGVALGIITILLYEFPYASWRKKRENRAVKQKYMTRWNMIAFASGKQVDYKNQPVELLITYPEFLTMKMQDGTHCHDFIRDRFLYDEIGVYGFDNLVVGFKTKRDADLYNSWYKNWREENPYPASRD